jgi:hypothetical protein
LDLADRIKLDPADIPDLAGLVCDEDFRRAAERLATRVRSRAAHEDASAAWKEVTAALREQGGRPRFWEDQRPEFIERHVAKAMADYGARAAVVARIETLLRQLKARGVGTGPG